MSNVYAPVAQARQPFWLCVTGMVISRVAARRDSPPGVNEIIV